MPDVYVVHLVWAPLGVGPLERFLASYRKHDAGLEHRLAVIFNGFAGRQAAAGHRATLEGLEHAALFPSTPTLDLPAYVAAANTLDAGHLCFLNSHSEVLFSGWLAALHDRLGEPGVGVVAATGSYEAIHSILPLRRRWWPGFPNPHLRTNAFMLPRDLMRSLAWPGVRTKARAWELESGWHGLTRQVWGRRLASLVVGRDGRGYRPEEWPASGTFRSGGQMNLLVGDNRTREWDAADALSQRELSRRAWGEDPVAAAARAGAVAGTALGSPG